MTKRTSRISEQILRELSKIISEELTDPRIGFVTLTGAEVSEDLSQATIYFTVLGGEKERRDSFAGLISARRFLKAALGKKLNIRRIPELRFEYDESVNRGIRIFEKLQEIKEKRDEDESEEKDNSNT